MNIDDPLGMSMRWRILISEFDFELGYNESKLNVKGDFMSLFDSDTHTNVEIDDEIPRFLSNFALKASQDNFLLTQNSLQESREAVEIEELLR